MSGITTSESAAARSTRLAVFSGRRSLRGASTAARVFCGFLATAATLAPAAGDEMPPVSATALRAHAEFLAHDRLEGRETGGAGLEIAALYAESQFRQWGLEPGAGDSYRQLVPFRRARFISATFAGGAPGALQPFRWREEFLISPSTAHELVDLEAPLLFVGYGMSAPELGRDDYAGADARGRVVLLLAGAPDDLPYAVRAHYSSSKVKTETAARHGAVGMVLVRTRLDESRRPWEQVTANVGQPSLTWLAPDGAAHAAFPEIRFQALLSQPAARRLLAAGKVSLDEILDAAEKRDRAGLSARALGVEVAVHAEHAHDRIESPNVIAKLAGSDPELGREVVVCTAHLDHIGVGAPVEGDAIYNGFYDNAIGSAILLEMARRLAAVEPRPRRTILFALVTGEERGLLGSDYFVHHPTVPAESLVANVNLDSPLFLGPVEELVAWGAEHSTLGALAERAATAHGFRLGPDRYPEEVFFVRSDQYAFVRAGIPAIFLDASTEPDDPGPEAYLRDHYHRPSDDARLAVHWPSVTRYVEANGQLLELVASSAEPPRWHAGDFFGERFARPAESR